MEQTPHSCCCGPKNPNIIPVCQVCKNPGIPVSAITIESLTREERRSQLTSLEGFSFCRTPDCAVVYFNNDTDEIIEKGDVKVRVGIKETEDPVHLCYCFGWTQKKIDDEITRSGKSLAVEDIMNRMKTTGCKCERNNPSGGCCLKDVTNYVDRAKR